MRYISIATLLFCLLACGCESESDETVRPVRTLTAQPVADRLPVSLTGLVKAHTYVNASFRIGGKVVERMVSAGDRVRRGDILARLDDTVIRDTLLTARADVAASLASLDQARKQDRRVRALLGRGAVSRREGEASESTYKSALARLDAARARQESAEEQLSYTVLHADVDGVVVSRSVENGEVVAAGQGVFLLAASEGRDAVFDLPEDLLDAVSNGRELEVCLDRQREICSKAEVYETSPEADAVTRTYQMKARIADASRMTLGATLIGTIPLGERQVVILPALALADRDGKPAVWVVDAEAGVVCRRTVEVVRYTADEVVIPVNAGGVAEHGGVQGLAGGEQVVTAGVQTLREGQKVRVGDGRR